MAYDEYLADRITHILERDQINFYPKKMMGGLIFMVNEKMCCGIHIHKKSNQGLLMARIGKDQYETAIKLEHTLPMDFTGRPMKGYIFVTMDGIDTDEQLSKWVHLAVNFVLTLT